MPNIGSHQNSHWLFLKYSALRQPLQPDFEGEYRGQTNNLLIIFEGETVPPYPLSSTSVLGSSQINFKVIRIYWTLTQARVFHRGQSLSWEDYESSSNKNTRGFVQVHNVRPCRRSLQQFMVSGMHKVFIHLTYLKLSKSQIIPCKAWNEVELVRLFPAWLLYIDGYCLTTTRSCSTQFCFTWNDNGLPSW